MGEPETERGEEDDEDEEYRGERGERDDPSSLRGLLPLLREEERLRLRVGLRLAAASTSAASPPAPPRRRVGDVEGEWPRLRDALPFAVVEVDSCLPLSPLTFRPPLE